MSAHGARSGALVAGLCIVAGLTMAGPPAVLEAQSVLARWDVPEGRRVMGGAAFAGGQVALWLDDGVLQRLDAELRPAGTTRIDGRIMAARDTPEGDLELLLAEPATLMVLDAEFVGEALPVPIPPHLAVASAAAIGDTWFLLVRSRDGGADDQTGTIIAWSPSSEPMTFDGPVPRDARLREVAGRLAITEATGRMVARFYDRNGHLVKTVTPRYDVIDSLTVGSLGVRGARWRSGSVQPFYEDGLLQPIRDEASDRTIMMTYDSTGVPVEWGVVLGAQFEVISFVPEGRLMLAVVQHEGRETVQKLSWPEN